MRDESSRRFVADLREVCRDEYTPDQGKTWIKGQSLSYVLDHMRKDKGWRFPGHRHSGDYIKTIKEAGFTVRRARSVRYYRGGTKGLSVECDCVTFP